MCKADSPLERSNRHCRVSVATSSTQIVAAMATNVKYRKEIRTMANEARGLTPVESAEGLLRELKQKAEAAHKANDSFTLSLMAELIKVTSPIVTKAVNRYHREE